MKNVQEQRANVKRSLAIFLEMDNIEYNIIEDTDKRVLIHTCFSFEHGTMGYYMDYQAEYQCLHFRCYSYQHIPEHKRNEVQSYYSKLNLSTVFWASIHLNVNDGSTFSKSSILLHEIEDLGLETIRSHFVVNHYHLSEFLGAALKIGFGNYTADQAFEEICKTLETRLN